MLKHMLAAACLLTPGLALAEGGAPVGEQSAAGAPATASPYAVPVETLELGGAKAGLMQTGTSAGGYSILVRQSQASSQFFTETKSRLKNSFQFKKDDALLFEGACTLQTAGHSMFGIDYNATRSQSYACSFKDQAEGQYAFETVLPAFKQAKLSPFASVETVTGPEEQAMLKSRLVYKGATYDALPLGFGKDNPWARRVVSGYAISRDGKPVGELKFDSVDGKKMSMGFNTNNKGTVTAPTAEADGREAILFFALNLVSMPDMFAPATREQVLGGGR